MCIAANIYAKAIKSYPNNLDLCIAMVLIVNKGEP